MGARSGYLSWGSGGSGGGGGGGVQPVVTVSYATLVSLINSNGLTPGQSYQFTNTTVTYIQFSGSMGSEQVHVGTPETLVVVASSSNTLQPEAYSVQYPKDIIYYMPEFSDRDYDAVAGQSTGVIYYRESTSDGATLSNSRDYDFRNVIFRRWETINGSGVFDNPQDTGFAFLDYSPMIIGACAGVKISSPGPLAPAVGTPYQLDNVVLDSSDGSGYVLMTFLGYGCTFFKGFNFMDAVLCVRVTVYNGGTSFEGGFITNLTINELDHNRIAEITDVTLFKLNENTISRIYDTNVPTGNYDYNYFTVATGNTATDVTNNFISVFNNNDCLKVIDNNCIFIENNVIPGASSAIQANVVNNISSNIGIAGPASVGIKSNVGNNIGANTLGVFSIINNIVQRIWNNTMSGNIVENSGHLIEANEASTIGYNNVSQIKANVLAGTIDSNTGQHISNNETGTGSITANIVNYISANINTNASNMPIQANIGYLISDNDIDFAISYNTVNTIYANRNEGIIHKNIGQSISSNLNSGSIEENMCVAIEGNLVGIGSIFGNIVYYIKANNRIGLIGGPHLLKWNNGQNITSSTFGGQIYNVNNVRIHSSSITAEINSHTFLAAISGAVINPTAAMQAGYPTQHIWDVGSTKYREMIITSGVITFTDIN